MPERVERVDVAIMKNSLNVVAGSVIIASVVRCDTEKLR